MFTPAHPQSSHHRQVVVCVLLSPKLSALLMAPHLLYWTMGVLSNPLTTALHYWRACLSNE